MPTGSKVVVNCPSVLLRLHVPEPTSMVVLFPSLSAVFTKLSSVSSVAGSVKEPEVGILQTVTPLITT